MDEGGNGDRSSGGGDDSGRVVRGEAVDLGGAHVPCQSRLDGVRHLERDLH